MKILSLLVIAVITTVLFSFKTRENEGTRKHQSVFVLDKSLSTLGWKGGENESYFHTGLVKFNEGSVLMEHGAIVNGSFGVDLSTISVNDAGLVKEKQDGLAKHLQNEDFFNVAKFATSKVTVGSFKDGKLSVTISLMGADIKQDIPVTVTSNENGATVKGKFDVDFSAAKIPGTQKVEGENDHISPIFTFDLNLVLKSK